MPKKSQPTKNWNEVPDMMSPQDYADVMGVTSKTAYKRFGEKGFPRVIEGRVSKSELKKHLGIKEEQSEVYSILLEIKQGIDELKEYEKRRLELIKSLI